jgi:hypothetical protein
VVEAAAGRLDGDVVGRQPDVGVEATVVLLDVGLEVVGVGDRPVKDRSGDWSRIRPMNPISLMHLTSFSCQVHATTRVLLDIGATPNQQLLDTRSGNTHNTAAGSPNWSGRFLKPVRPLLLD